MAVTVSECEPYKRGPSRCTSDGDNTCSGTNNNSGPLVEDWAENTCCTVEASKSPTDMGATMTVVPTSLNNDPRETVVLTAGKENPSETHASILTEEREWCDAKGPHVKVCWGETKDPMGALVFPEVFEYFDSMPDILAPSSEELAICPSESTPLKALSGGK